MMKNDREEHIFDPYSTDDPNVGEVQYGKPTSADDRHITPDPDISARRVGQNSGNSAHVQPNTGTAARHGEPNVGDFSRGGAYTGEKDGVHSAVPQGRRASGELESAAVQEMSPKQLRRRVQGKTRHAGLRLNVGLLLTVLVFVLVVAGCVMYLTMCIDEQSKPSAFQTTAEPLVNVPAGTSFDAVDFDRVSVPNEKMREGDLILVNFEHEYKFPETSDVASVYDFKTKSYKVRDTLTSLSKAVILRFNALMDDFNAATGCADMLVNSGFRDYDFQNEIYTERVQTEGAEEAAKYVALPGYSEHHTALAMDLSVYLANGTSVAVADYELCDWFEEHAPDYGFVLRYPSEKADITRISYEAWHYRYVGVPHAGIMYNRGLCLEEYIDFLRQYRCSEKYLVLRQDTVFESDAIPNDADYAVYFVPASQGETTDIPVPKGMEYDISGNNVDGFVVTVRK